MGSMGNTVSATKGATVKTVVIDGKLVGVVTDESGKAWRYSYDRNPHLISLNSQADSASRRLPVVMGHIVPLLMIAVVVGLMAHYFI